MQGWRFSGAPRHGIGFGAGSSADLQPDDSWFGDPLSTPSLPSQMATLKRGAPSADASQPKLTTRRRTEDSLGRSSFEDAISTEPCQAAGSASRAALTQQIPSAALQAGRLSLEGLMPDLDVVPPGGDGAENVIAEVQRILGINTKDYRRVLDLLTSEWHDLQAIQSKYRRLMRLLHPDKRRKDVERRAGGKDRCDLAVRLVQEAMTAAKKEVPSTSEYQAPSTSEAPPVDPQRDVKERMRQMQEAQRRQARMAMQSQFIGKKPEGPDVDALLSDISQVLGESSIPRSTSTDAPSDPATTAELINLLAGLRK